MSSSALDLTHLVVVFMTIIRVVSVAAALLSNRHEPTEISDDVIAEMVYDFIREHDVQPLSAKTCSSDPDDAHPIKKRKLIHYDRERAKKCVMDDWLGPIPRFPDKSFECTFRIKRVMVDTIINHLAKRDSFWRQTLCRAGKPSISPYVKFLCGQKMLCYGVSASAFVDYFQMGVHIEKMFIKIDTRNGMLQ